MLNPKNKRLTEYFLCTVLFLIASFSHAETYTYDDTGRLTRVTYDDDTSISYTYDEAGNILEQTGRENSPPDSFTLVFPADGAIGLPTSIPLIWKMTTDPDEDTVSYQVTYCDNQAFTGCAPQLVASNSQDMIVYASIAGPFTGLFALGLFFMGSPKTRVKKQLAVIATIVFFSGLVACGGGGESAPVDPVVPPPPTGPVIPSAAADEIQFDITGLASATTYYWIVTADDGNGGSTDSLTGSFTTD